jgi:hypothetical protein
MSLIWLSCRQELYPELYSTYEKTSQHEDYLCSLGTSFCKRRSRPYHSSGSQSPACHNSSPGLNPGQMVRSCGTCEQSGTATGFLRVLRFPYEFSFLQLLHTHHTRTSPGAGTVGQTMPDVTNGLTVTLNVGHILYLSDHSRVWCVLQHESWNIYKRVCESCSPYPVVTSGFINRLTVKLHLTTAC